MKDKPDPRPFEVGEIKLNNPNPFIFSVCFLAFLIIMFFIIDNKKYEVGFEKGYKEGSHYALDTVQKILNHQLKQDSTVCSNVTFNDTLWYNLSNLKRR